MHGTHEPDMHGTCEPIPDTVELAACAASSCARMKGNGAESDWSMRQRMHSVGSAAIVSKSWCSDPAQGADSGRIRCGERFSVYQRGAHLYGRVAFEPC
jgi:hypothetical protein